MRTLSLSPSSMASDMPARFGYLSAIARSLAAEWQAHRAARNVEALSDEMLHDIGISRSDIEVAVRYGRNRRA